MDINVNLLTEKQQKKLLKKATMALGILSYYRKSKIVDSFKELSKEQLKVIDYVSPYLSDLRKNSVLNGDLISFYVTQMTDLIEKLTDEKTLLTKSLS